MKKLELIKKNRKYFAAKLNDKYNCKLIIDGNSENLDLGVHHLAVEDISVRSKYGTDLIFKLMASADDINELGVCTIKSFAFNKHLSRSVKNLGGSWCGKSGAYVLSNIVQDKVDALNDIFNSELKAYEIEFLADVYSHKEGIYVCGYEVIRGVSRDSGAYVVNNAALIQGNIYTDGSRKNFYTNAEKGTILRMLLPEGVLKLNEDQDISIRPMNI